MDLIDRDLAIYELEAFRESCIANLMRMSFDDITDVVKYIPAVNRWIPCSERLPEMPIEGLDAMYSDCCLVCDSHDWIGMAYCLTDGNKTWWEFADAQNKVKIEWTEVTHWMPLPDAYEPEKEAENE